MPKKKLIEPTEKELFEQKTIKELKFDIAVKVFRGELLTKDEWHYALAFHYYMHEAPYEDYHLVHYEDEKIQGQLCLNDKTGKVNPKNHLNDTDEGVGVKDVDGRICERICLVGIHREDVNPDKLRKEQKKLW
jgi:hypothetical protein